MFAFCVLVMCVLFFLRCIWSQFDDACMFGLMFSHLVVKRLSCYCFWLSFSGFPARSRICFSIFEIVWFCV